LLEFEKKKKIRILILISGSIAAIRIPLLVSNLIKNNFEVKCVLTKNAEQFIQPISLSTLSRNKCILDKNQWDYEQVKPLHISLSDWADFLIMAPLTATTLSKWVHGNAEGLVSSILIANKNPVIVAPAMNSEMWNNSSVRENYLKLKNHKNILILEPSEGLLACDQFGIGKIPSNDLINLALQFVISQNKNFKFNDLENKSFLITGGATSEQIDPARRITNNSSGSMGLNFAQVARFRGAKVSYVHGKLKINSELKEGLSTYEIDTGEELLNVLKEKINNFDYFVMNAAVTDIKLSKHISAKLPKNELNNFLSNNLEMVPDILKELSNHKKSNQLFMGFCAFTGSFENLRDVIKHKFNIKGCDLIFANPIDIEGQGFGNDTDNEGWLFDKNGMEHFIKKTSKVDLANKLINKIISINK